MIKRYYATKDNTISNAFNETLTTRATGSNMGASDILEVFSIYGQESSGSSELARVLIEFDTAEISSDRATGKIGASGSVSFFLRMYNAPHSQTTPRDYSIEVLAVGAAWQEGFGIDMDNYEDITKNNIGSNWIKRSGATSWTKIGGQYLTDASSSFTQSFSTGFEDLELDVTTLVEQWLDSDGNVLGNKTNYGFGVKLVEANEAYFSSSTGADIDSSGIPHNVSGATRSFFTKKFFGRESEFFFQRPVIEARSNDSRKDDRGNFFFSSSLAPGGDNLNTIFLYNYVRGRLTNIPSVGAGNIGVSLFSGSTTDPTGSELILSVAGGVRAGNTLVATGSHVSTGVYSCTFAYTGSADLTKLYDVWFKLDNSVTGAAGSSLQFTTGSITPKTFAAQQFTEDQKYVLTMPNLQKQYRQGDSPKLRLYARERNWSPNIFTVATNKSIPSLLFESASYQIKRAIDDLEVVAYGTGSLKYTELSYDISGNYFNLDTSMLEAGYNYQLCFAIYSEDSKTYVEQPDKFKFRVVKNEY